MSKILVCNPSCFSLEYEINPWMSMSNKPNEKIAEKQWNNFHDALSRCGAELKYISPRTEVPDMVFVANAGLVRGNRVILSNFKHHERRPEKQYYKEWFLNNGYQVIEIPEHIIFEGAGDALFLNNTLFMGHGFRTDIKAHQLIATALGVKVVSCELINPKFYHLDTCFYTSKNRIVYYKDAFSKKSLTKILNAVTQEATDSGDYFDIVNVGKELAGQFVCNSVCIGENVISPSIDCASVFYTNKITYCDMSEFIKAGGAIKCLTLQL